jgi:hypothetical protein
LHQQVQQQEDQRPVDSPRRRVPGRPFKPGVSGNPSGRASPRIRAEAEEADRKIEAAALVASLDHKPSRLEQILITELSSLIVQANRLRRAGRPTLEVSALIMRLTDRLGGPSPAESSGEGVGLADRLGAARLAYLEQQSNERSATTP